MLKVVIILLIFNLDIGYLIIVISGLFVRFVCVDRSCWKEYKVQGLLLSVYVS